MIKEKVAMETVLCVYHRDFFDESSRYKMIDSLMLCINYSQKIIN